MVLFPTALVSIDIEKAAKSHACHQVAICPPLLYYSWVLPLPPHLAEVASLLREVKVTL